MPNPMVDKIRDVVCGPVEGAGYEIVEIEWKREPGGWVCRLFVDKSSEGISLDDCERISREVSAVLEVADVIPQQYNLEVSSPGLDRPLRTVTHFRKFVGQTAQVKLIAGVDGRRNYKGTIVAVPEEAPPRVVIEVDGKEHTLPLDDLDRANLVFDFNRQSDRKRE